MEKACVVTAHLAEQSFCLTPSLEYHRQGDVVLSVTMGLELRRP